MANCQPDKVSKICSKYIHTTNDSVKFSSAVHSFELQHSLLYYTLLSKICRNVYRRTWHPYNGQVFYLHYPLQLLLFGPQMLNHTKPWEAIKQKSPPLFEDSQTDFHIFTQWSLLQGSFISPPQPPSSPPLVQTNLHCCIQWSLVKIRTWKLQLIQNTRTEMHFRPPCTGNYTKRQNIKVPLQPAFCGFQ